LSNGWLRLGNNFKWREEDLRRETLSRVLEGLFLINIIGIGAVEIVYHNIVDRRCLRASQVAHLIYWSLG